ncbi:MAG: NUDIX domain-containing protein [Nitrolancea sp.]
MPSQRFQTPVAVHVMLLRGGEVLLLRRVNTGYEDGNYSVVGGRLDGGETVPQAAVREALEEAGVHIAEPDVKVVGVMHRRTDGEERIDFFVAVHRWDGEIHNREPHKCAELAWYDFDQLPENVITYVRQAFTNYCQGIWFGDFGWD